MTRKLCLILIAAFCLTSTVHAQSRKGSRNLVSAQVSGITATTVTRATIKDLADFTSAQFLINITAGGTATGTLTIWIQDSPDNGTTWCDLVSSNTFALGAAAVTQTFYVDGYIATTSTQGATCVSEALAAGTARQGPFGPMIRVREKLASPSGSPVGATYTVSAVFK